MTNDSRLTFSEAAEAWLESRRQYLHPNTMRAYRVDLKPLMPLIGGISDRSDRDRAYPDLSTNQRAKSNPAERQPGTWHFPAGHEGIRPVGATGDSV